MADEGVCHRVNMLGPSETLRYWATGGVPVAPVFPVQFEDDQTKTAGSSMLQIASQIESPEDIHEMFFSFFSPSRKKKI